MKRSDESARFELTALGLIDFRTLKSWSYCSPSARETERTMTFSDDTFDPETKSLMSRVLEEAWLDLTAMLVAKPIKPDVLREQLAIRCTAARNRERDPKQLKLIALGAV